jgi:two-component sensor histidine kinase
MSDPRDNFLIGSKSATRLLLFAAAVSFPLLLGLVWVIWLLANAQWEEQKTTLRLATSSLTAAVDSEIQRHLAVAQSLANFVPLANGDRHLLYQHAVAATASLPGTWALLADLDGNQLINTLRPVEEPLPPVLNYDLVKKVADIKRPYVSDLIQGALIRRLFTAVYVPAFKEGLVTNVAIFPMDTSEISKILVRQPVPTGWVVGVIDRNGRFIARSRDEASQLGSLASEGWRAAAKKEREGVFENISMEGVPLFSAHKRTESADWSVSIGAPRAVLTSAFRESVLITVTVVMLAMFLSAAIAIAVARAIVRHTSSLLQGADAMLANKQFQPNQTGILEIDRALLAFSQGADQLLEKQKTQDLMLNELSHRMQNTLAVIQALAVTASKDCRDVHEFVRSFTSRLNGIARANSVLTSSKWRGASLSELLTQSLMPYADDYRRISLQGPDVWIPAKEALALALTFHELATNAGKYGALSRAEGTISVLWVMDENAVDLTWTERDGPSVVPPGKSGFGTRLVQLNVEQLHGTLDVNWEERGLTIKIRFPSPDDSER